MLLISKKISLAKREMYSQFATMRSTSVSPVVTPSNDHRDRLLSWLQVQLGKILVNIIYDYTNASNVC